MKWFGGPEFNRRLNDEQWRASEDPEWGQRFAISQRLLRPIIRHYLGLTGASALLAGSVYACVTLGGRAAFWPIVGWAAAVWGVQFAVGFMLGAAAERIQWGTWRATFRAGVAWGVDALLP